MDKDIVWLVLHVVQVGKVAGIRQFVEIDDAVVGIFVYHQAYHVRSDKSGSTGHDYVAFIIAHLSDSSCVMHFFRDACQ